MNNLREAFYDSYGNVWQPSKNGHLLTCIKKMPKTSHLSAVPGEHGFFAHVNGLVYSAWAGRGKGKHKLKYKMTELTLVNPVEGRVNLYSRTARLDEVILETFVGPCPEGCKITHLNGDNDDCAVDNLRWRPITLDKQVKS